MYKEKLEYINILQPLFIDELGWNVGGRVIIGGRVGTIVSTNKGDEEVYVNISIHDALKKDKKDCLLYPNTYELWSMVKNTDRIYIQWINGKSIRIVSKEGFVTLVECEGNDFELLFMKLIMYQEGL